jgi:dipeptidyl aminopeptidase/acylaminoacyl peptidase
MAPVALERLVNLLLAKDPDERIQDAHDVALRLREIGEVGPGDSTAVISNARSAHRRLLPVVAAALALLSALLAVQLYRKPSGSDLGAYRFTPFATASEREEEAAWSPDGRSIAYVKLVGGHAQIFVRSLDADSPVPLTHVSDDARRPFWWPDSSRIGFVTNFSAGGTTRGFLGEVWSVGSAGGEPDLVQRALAGAATLSPDGKTLATWRITRDENGASASVWLASPPTAEARKYTPAPFEVRGEFGPNYLRFSPDGAQILAAFWAPSSALWLLPFPDSAGAHGPPHQIFKDAPLLTPPALSWMPDSRHVVMATRDTPAGRTRLWMADTRAETLRPLTAGVMNEDEPDVSPDGSKIVFTSGGFDFDLVDVPLARFRRA